MAEGNRRLEAGDQIPGFGEAVAEMLQVIGLENLMEDEEPGREEAGRLAEEREHARREGDFERADALRRELAERGYEVREHRRRTGARRSSRLEDLRAQPRRGSAQGPPRVLRQIWRSDRSPLVVRTMRSR